MKYCKGNLVLTEYGILPVKHIAFDKYMVEGKDGRLLWADEIGSVPITEIRLVDLGFYYSDDDHDYLELPVIGKFKLHADRSNNFSSVTFRIGDYEKAIYFIHKIQNLYYELTNKFLTLNSNL